VSRPEQTFGRQAGNVKPAKEKQQEQAKATRRAEGKPAAKECGHGRKHAGKNERHSHWHQDRSQQVQSGNQRKNRKYHLRGGCVFSLSIQGDTPVDLASRSLAI
jgi:hypothetical protein